jgi:para-aminobenzoate synthetase
MTDPVAHFREVAARHARCFWLDGGGAREWSGRRSLIGWLDDDDVSLTYDAACREVRRHRGGRSEVVGDDVFAALETELASGDDADQWFGYFGYASRPDLPAHHGSGLPDAIWMRSRNVRFFTHPSPPPIGHEPQLPAPEVHGWGPNPEPPAPYAAGFGRVQEELHAGNSYEVNLTYRLEVASDLDPVSAYLRLRTLNPAPYAGFLQHDLPGHRAWLLSSSPERYALVTADRVLETKPIKGTTPRGETAAEDAVLLERLASEPKFRSENLMIVDLLRNDLSMVCEPGTVEVPVLMDVESYATVHQLVSTVRGRLREDVSTLGALHALFPAGSMTGAPKLRTMHIIDGVEDTPRGAYAGAFGWIAADGRADLGVVIRSLMTTGDGRYLLGTGGGITVHSDLAEEYAESRWKADRMLRVFLSE